ncbi:MAG: T6SS phospholipase effector Tle1-like catalytic domain-containing protein [Methylobacter sp.]
MKTIRITFFITLSVFIFGYTSPSAIASTSIYPLKGDPQKHKSIFVFLDGTENNSKSGTNVWRLYDLISKSNDPQTTAIYIEGVGTAEDPLNTRQFEKVEKSKIENTLGLALGKDMQERILRGYEYIARNYNFGDDIYIFGFSRGAHEARSLAGLLSYAGIPILSDDDRKKLVNNKDYLTKIGNDILELTKKKSDKDYLENWKTWEPNKGPLLSTEIKKSKINGNKNRQVQTAEITFLGVWDTVPGSSLKHYEECKEKKGFIKRKFAWLIPGIDKGERYKTDSYPAIHQIAHAVALDEKRSKFEPILICPPINNSNPTKVTEVWFPGAHADIGGGYNDSSELPNISLNWMIDLLEKSYTPLTSAVTSFPAKAAGLAHWSIGDSPGNKFSDCMDRSIPEGAKIDKSYEERKNAGKVPIRKDGEVKSLAYPIKCPSSNT